MPEIGLGHEASIRGQRSSKGLAVSQKPPKVLFFNQESSDLARAKTGSRRTWRWSLGTASRKMCSVARSRAFPMITWGQSPSAVQSREARQFWPRSRCGKQVEILWPQSVDTRAAGPVTLKGFEDSQIP